MKVKIGLALIGIAAVLLDAAAMPARGALITLSVYENSSNVPTAGLNLTIDLVDNGSTADLVFKNQSTIPAVVTALYVESNQLSTAVLSGGQIVSPQVPGVAFSPGATPPNPAGSISGFGGAWAGNLFSADADSPGPTNGLSPGESVTLRFATPSGFDALLSALSSSPAGFRIAEQVQGIGSGASVWAMSTTIPTPAASAYLAAAMILRPRRRR